jgi:hypothetical protein
MGHWARECRSKPKKEQANVAHEEEEASLLLVKAVIERPSAVLGNSKTSTPVRAVALMVEV